MATITDKKSLNYHNVNLIAQPGAVESRKQIPIEGWRIIVSAMTSIVGTEFIKAVAELDRNLRPTIHIPRDVFAVENLKLANKLNLHDNIIVGLGLNTPHLEALAITYGFNKVLLDVANGYLPQVVGKAKELSDKGFEVCTGSVHTETGAFNLIRYGGVHMVRSGIAPGSVCITKDSTGFTRGTITEIMELHEACQDWPDMNPVVLADGGIKSPADCVKAFLAGASYIMTGRLFVEAIECRMHTNERELPSGEELPSNVYFGMASHYGKLAMGNILIDSIEGKFDVVSGCKTLEEILTTVWDGIRSGVSYSGYATLAEAIGNGVFEEIA